MRKTTSGASLAALVLAASLLPAACGAPAPAPAKGPDTLYQSGARLRARFTDAGIGARRFDGWWDTLLGSRCTFRRAEDGVRRCVPSGDGGGYGPYYTDPGCTLPVVTWVDPNQPLYWSGSGATASVPVVCGAQDLATLASAQLDNPVSSWRIVGGAQPSPPALYSLSPGGCTQLPDTGVTVVYPVERVAPTELVATTRTRVDPRGAALAIQMFDHADGSSMAGELFDVALVRGCFPSWVLGVTDDYRCYSGSLEGSCSPGARPPLGTCEGDVFVSAFDYCTPAVLTRVGNGTCDMVEPARIPELASDLLGTGRVRLVITHAADDARPVLVNPGYWENDGRYLRGPFFDTERQMPCDPTALEDGSVRCLTEDVIAADTYADAACTHLVAPKRGGYDPCARHSPPRTPRFAVAGSPARIYELGAEVHLERAYYPISPAAPETCTPLSVPGVDAYELIPADASIFATLEVGTE